MPVVNFTLLSCICCFSDPTAVPSQHFHFSQMPRLLSAHCHTTLWGHYSIFHLLHSVVEYIASVFILSVLVSLLWGSGIGIQCQVSLPSPTALWVPKQNNFSSVRFSTAHQVILSLTPQSLPNTVREFLHSKLNFIVLNSEKTIRLGVLPCIGMYSKRSISVLHSQGLALQSSAL